MHTPLLRMEGVSKRFGATQALSSVSLQVERGQVHALIGENGAGKSTLMKVLSGVHRADEGELHLEGQRFTPSDPAAARRTGVAMIYQELNLAPDLSVEANILLGSERARWGWVDRAEHRRIARRALGRLADVEIDPERRVGDLPIAQQQLVEIARALASDAQVLVFDEPTSSLGEGDVQRLFEVIRELRSQDLGIVYISHFLDEVAQISDVFTVLRDGEVVAHERLDAVSLDDIVRAMVGREIDEMFPRVAHEPGEPLLEIEGLSGTVSPRDVDLVLRRGEILGISGLIGAGRSELVRCIFGLEPVRGGEVRVVGTGRLRPDPRAAIAAGLGLVSEDRKEEGVALSLSIADNVTLSRPGIYGRGGWIDLRRRRRAVQGWLERTRCKAAGPDQIVDELSGGNQQKVAMVRLLHQDADVLLLDEPTRGIDVGTKAEIYRWIGELAARGKAVVLVSSYLPELMHVCDRIAVMHRGRVRAVRPAEEWTEEDVMHVATGRAEDS